MGTGEYESMLENIAALVNHQVRRVPDNEDTAQSHAFSQCRILHTGDHLFFGGDQDHDAYLIRSGHVKSYTNYENGEEQILGLHGPGDVLGFDALLGQPSMCSARVVDTAHVQVIAQPAQCLSAIHDSEMAQVVLYGLYQELLRSTRLLHMDRHPAERRLSEFLLDYSERQCARGQSCDELMLPVSRRDLANYLGLAPETLSRTLSNLQTDGVLEVDNRHVGILDRDALAGIAQG